MHVAGYLKNFMFDPKILDNKVATLSGGEANRLLLAKSLINSGNFFVLDEPTNDLDMDSLDMLLEILAGYTGTLIIVSHDRDFLESLVTRTLVFTKDEIIDLYGGYEDYLKYYRPNQEEVRSAKIKPIVPKQVRNVEKISYKYMRLLEILPGEIEMLEEQIAIMEHQLAEPDLYNSDSKKFEKLSQQLQKSTAELEIKLEQWIEVEAMQNKIEK